MVTTSARTLQRAPLPLLPAHAGPARTAARVGDPTAPPASTDRLAEQYGVVPVDVQRAPAAPAVTAASGQSARNSQAAPAVSSGASDANELAEKVWQVIQDKLAIERERRGYASWL